MQDDILKRIHDYALEEIMGERFGRYAKEIITDRAIPDVRDGLKPVQRRILYGMYKGKNTYDNKYRKSMTPKIKHKNIFDKLKYKLQ